jgi:hypothetical protein
MLIVCYRLFAEQHGGPEYVREYGLIALAALGGYLVSAQFVDVRFFAFYNSLVFCIVGIAYSMLHAARQTEPSKP